MKMWFQNLSRREQGYLLAMSFSLLLWSLYQFALQPAAQQRDQMAQNNRVASQLLARVDAKVTQLLALRAAGEAGGDGNLTSAISRSSELAGLPVRRLQPNSRGEVQVRFESVDYDNLVRWLHRIEVVEGLVVVDASIAQAGRSGGVNATLRIAEAN